MTRRITGWFRWLAWFMAFILCLSCIAPMALADEDTDTEPADEEDIVQINIIEENGDAYEDLYAPAEEASEDDADIGGDDVILPDEPSAEDPDEPAGDTPAEDTPADDSSEASDETPAETTDGAPDSESGGSSEEPDENGFTVSYYINDTLLSEEKVVAGESPVNVPKTSASGTPIKGWMDKAGKNVVPGSSVIEADTAFYAWLAPALERDEHIRYINGKGEGLFQPTQSLTRAEAATILYNLLESKQYGPLDVSFADVSSGAWYYTQVMTLASYGVLNGYPDGTFQPNRYVTRAEFVTMIVNLIGGTGSSSNFTDIANNWARASIEIAVSNGWITGYQEQNGTYTFRPARQITRAEAVVIVNRVLGRTADANALATGSGILHYLDVPATAWYYSAIMEASIRHTYERTGSGETWTEYTVESTGMTQGIHTSGSGWFYIDSNGQPVHMKAGINSVDGKYFYSSLDGYYFTGNLSSKSGYCVFFDGTEKQLTAGLNRIDTTRSDGSGHSSIFYWISSSNKPQQLKKGLNTISGKTYLAREAGYDIRADFSKGVVEQDGKYYLSSGKFEIITSGTGYKNATSKPTTIDLKQQTYEFNGCMYYLKSDYSLAHNEWIGYLYFGKNCAYTSGDSAIDNYVWNVVKDFINNNALTKEQKLLRAYYYIRGGSGSTEGSTPFSYSRKELHGYDYNRYNWQEHLNWAIYSAYIMFKDKKGMCYEWASVYLYMARRLGFQAYPIIGTVGENRARHCWCMIQWDGAWHISDVEMEWGYITGWYTGQRAYWNLFDQKVSNEYFTTYRNPECGLLYTVPSS